MTIRWSAPATSEQPVDACDGDGDFADVNAMFFVTVDSQLHILCKTTIDDEPHPVTFAPARGYDIMGDKKLVSHDFITLIRDSNVLNVDEVWIESVHRAEESCTDECSSDIDVSKNWDVREAMGTCTKYGHFGCCPALPTSVGKIGPQNHFSPPLVSGEFILEFSLNKRKE
jgi:hypothetical protein